MLWKCLFFTKFIVTLHFTTAPPLKCSSQAVCRVQFAWLLFWSMIQKSNFIHIFPWWGKSQWTFPPPLSASLTSWENYYLNGPGGLFLLHFLLLGMLKVGVFQHNRKYLIRLRTWSSLLCHFCKTEKRVWEKQTPTDCQKKKKKICFLFQSCKQYVTHGLAVVPWSGKSFGTFFSSQFCFLLCMKQ